MCGAWREVRPTYNAALTPTTAEARVSEPVRRLLVGTAQVGGEGGER